jgi:hypothetical protein
MVNNNWVNLTIRKMAFTIFTQYILSLTENPVFGRKVAHVQGARLEEMRMHTILKPECTTVHEARFKIWQNFVATQQMGEFSSKHYL